MSNFICSECGMTNIDCGYAGYKTPKEIKLEKQIADLSKKVERLQEQLKEANEVLKDTAHWATDETENQKKAREYLEKWGVK